MFLRWNESGHDYILWWSCGPSFGFIQNCRRGKKYACSMVDGSNYFNFKVKFMWQPNSNSNSCDKLVHATVKFIFLILLWCDELDCKMRFTFPPCSESRRIWVQHLESAGPINIHFLEGFIQEHAMSNFSEFGHERSMKILTVVNFRFRWLVLEAELNFWHQCFQICPSRMTSRRFVGWSG